MKELIGTFNTNGLGDYTKCQEVFHYLHKLELKIVYLQETHTTPMVERQWKTEWGG